MYISIEAGRVRDSSVNTFTAKQKKIEANSPTPQKGAPPESNNYLLSGACRIFFASHDPMKG